MKQSLLFLSCVLLCFSFSHADENKSSTVKKNETKKVIQKEKSNISHKKENNSTHNKDKKIADKIKKQMELEEKYAKEQRFYQGDEYDLKAHEVDPNSLPDVPIIEPDDDFDITDVYRDDI
jgi:cell division protein FtsX